MPQAARGNGALLIRLDLNCKINLESDIIQFYCCPSSFCVRCWTCGHVTRRFQKKSWEDTTPHAEVLMQSETPPVPGTFSPLLPRTNSNFHQPNNIVFKEILNAASSGESGFLCYLHTHCVVQWVKSIIITSPLKLMLQRVAGPLQSAIVFETEKVFCFFFSPEMTKN